MSTMGCLSDAPSPNEPRPAAVIWQASVRAMGPPAVDENSVYFSTRDHTLAAVNRATGAIRWIASSGISGDPPARDTPVRAADVIVFGDEYLFGFEPGTGKLRWVFGKSGGLEPRVGIYPFKTDGTRIFAGSVIGAVFAIDAATGVQVWRTDLFPGSDNQVRVIAVRDGLVYVTVRYNGPFYVSKVVVLETTTGAVRWTYESGRSSLAGDVLLPPPNEPRQLFLVVLDDGRIVALDARTGDLQWTIGSLAVSTGGDDRRMTVSGDVLVATSTRNGASDANGFPDVIVGYDLATGDERWRVRSTQGSAMPNLGRVSSDAELAYIVFTNGVLGCYELLSGKVRALVRPPLGLFDGAPTISHDTLFVGGWDAGYAIRR
jgi:outer membrane protein assembly factor BamB